MPDPIRSKPSTGQYRRNYDRTFGKSRRDLQDDERADELDEQIKEFESEGGAPAKDEE